MNHLPKLFVAVAAVLLGPAPTFSLQLEPASAPGKSPPTRNPQPRGGSGVAFDSADIALIADEIISRRLHRRYAIDPSVTGRMTFRTVARSNEALLADFESALALQDIALVRSGEQFLLTGKAKARSLAVARRLPSAASRLPAGYQAVIVQANHVAPSDLARLVSRGDTATSSIVADDKTGYLTLVGSSGELNALLANIAALDRPATRAGVTRTFSLTRADPLVVVAELKSLSETADFSGATLIPLPRLGQIVATARSESLLHSSWPDEPRPRPRFTIHPTSTCSPRSRLA